MKRFFLFIFLTTVAGICCFAQSNEKKTIISSDKEWKDTIRYEEQKDSARNNNKSQISIYKNVKETSSENVNQPDSTATKQEKMMPVTNNKETIIPK